MTTRQWLQLAALAVCLVAVACTVGVAADRLILRAVTNGPPQRLAAAMGGLFAGGLVFFAGMIAWFIKQRADS